MKTKTKRSKISLTRKRFSRKQANKQGGKSNRRRYRTNRRRYRTNKSKKYSRKRSKKYSKIKKKGGADETITLKVKAFYAKPGKNKSLHNFNIEVVNPEQRSVSDVRKLIHSVTRIPAERQTLVHKGNKPNMTTTAPEGNYEYFVSLLEDGDDIMMIADAQPQPPEPHTEGAGAGADETDP